MPHNCVNQTTVLVSDMEVFWKNEAVEGGGVGRWDPVGLWKMQMACSLIPWNLSWCFLSGQVSSWF